MHWPRAPVPLLAGGRGFFPAAVLGPLRGHFGKYPREARHPRLARRSGKAHRPPDCTPSLASTAGRPHKTKAALSPTDQPTEDTLGFGYHASNAPLDQLSNTLTGRFTNQTMWYFGLGAVATVGGALLALFGKGK